MRAFQPPLLSYHYPPLSPFTVDDDGCDPKASSPLSQGSPPLHHPQLCLHAPNSTRINALRSGAVSFHSGNVFSSRLIHVHFHP